MNKVYKKNNKAFGIIELIISIAIIASVIASVATVLRDSIKASSLAKDEVQAIYLAQDAVEILRHVRDNNRLSYLRGNNTNWLQDIARVSTDPCYFGKTCMVDATKNNFGNLTFFRSCTSTFESCDFLRQNTSTGLYGYDTAWTQTKYKRAISLTQNSANDVLVTVSVKWSRGINDYDYTYKTILMNWK